MDTSESYSVPALLRAIEERKELCDRVAKESIGKIGRVRHGKQCEEKSRMLLSILARAAELTASSASGAPSRQEGLMVVGTYACPICGKDTPHTHRSFDYDWVREFIKKLREDADSRDCGPPNRANDVYVETLREVAEKLAQALGPPHED